jgi:broad specificity phosphatase PhoE
MLLLVRHGETNWNRAKRWQGSRGAPLNDAGRQQAREVAVRLADDGLCAVYASDAVRAVETAKIVARRFGLAVEIDERLRETDFGDWEGLTRPEVQERSPRELRAWDAFDPAPPPNGESELAMAERVIASLTEIAERHRGGRVVVVTSGGPIAAAQAHAAGIEPADARRSFQPADNCAVVALELAV